MNANDTHAQRREPTRLASSATIVALIAACLFGSWTWWLSPRREAALVWATTPALAEARAEARALLAEHGLELELDELELDELSWRAPGDCVEVYRLRVDERFRDASVALFVGRPETHASGYLALALAGTAPPGPRRAPVAVDSLLVPSAPGEARRRRLWWSAREVGPAAPDLACRRRSWDLVEDALALGWPLLPGGSVRVGQRWRGASVEGRCHETTCADDQGEFVHDGPCRARPWDELLAGAGAGVALVTGSWDDGHEPSRAQIGILTSREALIHEGRPLRVRASVDHRWSGVWRELELRRVDDCSGLSLATTEDRSAVEEIRARLRQPPGG